MKNEVAQLFGIDPMGDEVSLVRRQNRNDDDLLEEMILLRQQKFPILTDFAAEIGFDEKVVSEFEDCPTEASIRFLQMYALGLGIEIRHKVISHEDRHPEKQETEGRFIETTINSWLNVSVKSAGRSVFRKIREEDALYA